MSLVLAAWEPNDVITLVSILATVAIGVATIVTNHIREMNLHRRTVEADRAKPYRETALDAVAYARDATWECQHLLRSPLPTTPDEVVGFLASFEPALTAIRRAEQVMVRMATLGWSQSVRAHAKELYDHLLKLSVTLFMSRSLVEGRVPIPEGPSIAAGDPAFWTRWHSTTTADVEATEQKVREFEASIGD